MFKRIISLVLTLVLISSALPMTALADTFESMVQESMLTVSEQAEAKKLVAMEDSVAHWQEGQTITASSNSRQVEEFLECLLEKKIEGLLLSAQDVDALLGGSTSSLDDLVQSISQLHNEVEHYQQVLENGRSTLNEQLQNLNQGTLMEQYRLNRSVRQTMQEIKDAIQHVADNYASDSENYEDQYEKLAEQLRQTPSTADDLVIKASLTKLESEAAALTEQEQAAVPATNDGEAFTIEVLSSYLFGIKVMDTDNKAISGAKVTVSTSNLANRTTSEGTTNAEGMATFLVSSFTPDANNTVTLDVVIDAGDAYGVREAQALHIKGGNFVPFRLSAATGENYLRMVSFNGMDILSQQQTIYYSTKNDETFSFDVKAVSSSGRTDKLVLCYQTLNSDGSLSDHTIEKSFQKGETVSFSGQWCKTLAPGSNVTIQLVTGNETIPFKTQLVIESAVVDEPITKFNQVFSLLSDKLNFVIPEAVPFFGGDTLTLETPMPNYNLLIDPSGNIFFAYGKNYTDEAKNWKKENTWDLQTRYDEAGRENKSGANAIENGVYQGTPAVKSKFLGTAKATFTPFAAFQGKIGIKENTIAEKAFALTGYAGLQAILNADFTQTLWIWSFPTYASLDMKLALGSSVNLALQWDWDGENLSNLSLKKGSGWIINFLTEMGVSVGVGIKNLLSVGARFYGRLAALLKIGTPTTGKVTGSMGLQIVAQFLVMKYTHSVWEGSYTLNPDSDVINVTAANGTAAVVTGLTEDQAGVNKPVEPIPTRAPGANRTTAGLQVQDAKEMFSQVDSVAQEIQYVTLTSGNRTNTFAFWITPTGDDSIQQTSANEASNSAARTAELVWYNVTDTKKHGTVILANRSSAQQTMREVGTDYAFAVMGDGDLAAVIMIGGHFYGIDKDKIEACSADVAVLQMDENGSLNVLDYELLRHAQTYGGEGVLGQPMIFLTRYDSDEVLYYLVAGCAELEGSDAKATSATTAYFMAMQRSTGNVYQKYNVMTDSYDAQEGISSLAAMTPTNMTVNGDYLEMEGDSQRCYYSLGDDTNESTEEKGEAYNGTLYINLNGTHKQVDSDVSFIAPLTAANVTGEGGVDGNEYLFYLKRGTADDGSECYRLKSSCIDSMGKLTLTDYDIMVPTGRFNVTVINDGTGYGKPILYWLEYATEAQGDAESDAKTEVYRIRAVSFERTENVMYGPYTLTELTGKTANSVFISPELVYDNGGDQKYGENGSYDIYFTTDATTAANASDDARISQKLYNAEAPRAAGLEFLGIVSEDPCVNPGSNATLLFSVENTGNLPISAFVVEVQKDGTAVGNVVVACTNPANSVNGLLSSADTNQYPTTADEASAYSVERVDNVFDEQNGDFWVQQIDTELSDSNGHSFKSTTQVKSTALLMPGGVHTYKAGFVVPKDWEGTQNLTVTIKKIYIVNSLTDAVADGDENAADLVLPLENIYCVNENGSLQSTSNAVSYAPMRVVRVGSAEADKQQLGVGRGDMGLYCQPYTSDDGKRYVRVSIVGRSMTSEECIAQPTLTATLFDGTEVLNHTFTNSIDEDYAYTVDIPVAYLLGDREGDYVTFCLTDNESNVAYAEFSTADNERTVWLGNDSPLHIVQQPTSVETVENTNVSFAVEVAGGQEPYVYQWQRKDASGAWQDISSEGKAELLLEAVQLTDNEAQFRCVIADRYGYSVTSTAATLMVYATLAIEKQPDSVAVLENADATFNVSLSGGVQPYTYQWQRKAKDGSAWENVSGGTQADLQLEAVQITDSETQFRCVGTDSKGNTVTSEAATLTVYTPLAIVQQPQSISVLEGEDAAFAVVVSGGLQPYTYQWQRMNAFGRWENIDGETQPELLLEAVKLADDNAQFRCVVEDSFDQTVVSDVAVLTVQKQLPVTGDAANPALWAALMLLSAATVLMLIRRRRA